MIEVAEGISGTTSIFEDYVLDDKTNFSFLIALLLLIILGSNLMDLCGDSGIFKCYCALVNKTWRS
jgi:hypothetical protein